MPLKLGGRNLGEWLRRAGLNNPQTPLPYNDYVQPVEVVGEGQNLTSPQLPPTAIAGFDLPAAAQNVACWFQARSAGGAWIDQVIMGTVAQANFAFRVAPTTNPDAAISNSAPAFNLVPDFPVKSVLFYGLPAAVIMAQSQPMFRLGAAGGLEIMRDVYVPPGYYLLMENDSGGTASTITWYMKWREYTEAA